MIVDCCADLHSHFPKLEGGDLLIVAGDLTANDSIQAYDKFFDWFYMQEYKKKVFIAGNHDNMLFERKRSIPDYVDAEYLCDSGTEFEGFKIWGSPWTRSFEGQNPHCKAFCLDNEEELGDIFARIPEDVDILVTHSPPFTVLDLTKDGEQVGSTALMSVFLDRREPKLWVFGHIHNGYGTAKMNWAPTILVNASHVNENYEPVNKPIRIIL